MEWKPAIASAPEPAVPDEPTSAIQLVPGTRLGPFEILSFLAAGGMAEVYLARTHGLARFQKLVVLKRILPRFASRQDFVDLFTQEARLVAMLDHPNIGQVFHLGQSDGEYYMVMEYVRGRSLTEVLRTIAPRRRIDFEEAFAITLQLADALAHAHEACSHDGTPLLIVHHDISPGNVLLTYDGHVKLVDFGVARARTRTLSSAASMRMGKLPYMAPEQVLGRPVDHRSDIFSLGILLYEMTTMTRVYRGNTELEVIDRVAHGRITPPTHRVPGYPPELERVVMKALAVKPDARHSSARALLDDLELLAARDRMWTSPRRLRRVMLELF